MLYVISASVPTQVTENRFKPELIAFSRVLACVAMELKLLKVSDLIYLYTALFMYDYYSNRLPLIFDNFFKSINKVHQYQTRLASKISYYLPKARTNHGKFNIRFSVLKFGIPLMTHLNLRVVLASKIS